MNQDSSCPPLETHRRNIHLRREWRSMNDYLHIASFDDSAEAEKLAARLTQEGFKATTTNEAAEQFLKLYNAHPRAHCRVLVTPDRADEAIRRLDELDATEGVLHAAVRCPQCGSPRVEYPQFSRNTIMGALPAAAAALGLVDREFFCAACQLTWPPEHDPVETVPGGKDLLK